MNNILPIEIISIILWRAYQCMDIYLPSVISDDYFKTDTKAVMNLLIVCKLWNSVLTNINTIPLILGIIEDPRLAIKITKVPPCQITVEQSLPDIFNMNSKIQLPNHSEIIKDELINSDPKFIIDMYRWIDVFIQIYHCRTNNIREKWTHLRLPNNDYKFYHSILYGRITTPRYKFAIDANKFKHMMNFQLQQIDEAEKKAIPCYLGLIFSKLNYPQCKVILTYGAPDYDHISWMFDQMEKYFTQDLLCKNEFYEVYWHFLEKLFYSNFPPKKLRILVTKWLTYPKSLVLNDADMKARYIELLQAIMRVLDGIYSISGTREILNEHIFYFGQTICQKSHSSNV